MKRCVTLAPIAIIYDPTKLVFLKPDWSSNVMGWIIMQPDMGT